MFWLFGGRTENPTSRELLEMGSDLPHRARCCVVIVNYSKSVICCHYVSEFEHEFAFGHGSTFFSLCPHILGGLAFNCMNVSLSKLFFLTGPGPAKVF